ncbi:glutathione S-transferase [Pelagophyceae sp. CCMP2097]|nr:glutathione S-transferase [Pelagophyceae sp. CCMP2097]
MLLRAARSHGGVVRRLTSAAAPPPRAALTYYSAWFCPFAHRATLALAHHGESVPHKWVEALGWEQGKASGAEDFDAAERKDWWYHWKHPDLLKCNAQGMVPTLEQGGKVVTESIHCIQFVDELAKQQGTTATPLVSEDPWEAARQRLWADRVNKIVTAEYYKVLVRPEAERRDAFDRLVEGLRDFARNSRGNFFSGDSPGLVDFVLLPYAFRLYAIEHHRPGCKVPRDSEADAKYHAWLARCVALPQVAETLPDKDRYITHLAKYASGAARSKVGNAVRRGAEAHDYDDEKDGEEKPQ